MGRSSRTKKKSKKVNKRRDRKTRTLKKQKGGATALFAAGAAVVGIGVATAAYLGLDMLSKVNDTSIIKSMINSDNITFLQSE